MYTDLFIKSIMTRLSLIFSILCAMGFHLCAQNEQLPSVPQDMFRGISHPKQGVVYLSGSEGIYKSMDNGDSWVTIFTYDSAESSRFYGIWFWDEMNGFASCTPRRNSYWSMNITSKPGIYRTFDGGESWICMDSSRTYSNIQFVNSDTIFALSSGDVYKSSDGGYTWEDVFAGKGVTDYSIVNDHIIYALPKYSYDYAAFIFPTIYKSSDCGISWMTIIPQANYGDKPPHMPWIIDQCFFFEEGKGYVYGDHMLFTENDFASSESFSTSVISESEFGLQSMSKCLRSGFQMAVPRHGQWFHPISTSSDYGRHYYSSEDEYGYYVCDLTACEEDTVFFIITPSDIYRYKGSDFFGADIMNREAPRLQIYPQPVSDRFRIKYESSFDRIEIYDIQGKMIYNEEFSKQTETSISSDSWKKGLYLLKVFSKENVISGKIVK